MTIHMRDHIIDTPPPLDHGYYNPSATLTFCDKKAGKRLAIYAFALLEQARPAGRVSNGSNAPFQNWPEGYRGKFALDRAELIEDLFASRIAVAPFWIGNEENATYKVADPVHLLRRSLLMNSVIDAAHGEAAQRMTHEKDEDLKERALFVMLNTPVIRRFEWRVDIERVVGELKRQQQARYEESASTISEPRSSYSAYSAPKHYSDALAYFLSREQAFAGSVADRQ